MNLYFERVQLSLVLLFYDWYKFGRPSRTDIMLPPVLF